MSMIHLCIILGVKIEGTSLWWISILSLSLIISDFILRTLIKSCFKLFLQLKPTQGEISKFEFEFNLRHKYIPRFFLFLILLILIKFGGLSYLYYTFIKIHIYLYIKLFKRNLSIKNNLNSHSNSNNNVQNILDQTESYRNDFNIFFEYKNSTWYWYHYIYLMGWILSWISSLIFGFQNNIVWSKVTVFLTFAFLGGFQDF